MLTARDIMTDHVVTIGPDAFLQEAIEVLLEMGVSGLPVIDDRGQLIGIISEFALLTTAYDATTACDRVGQHMTAEVLTVNIDDPIRKVADYFIVHRVRRVPVMDRGRIAGLITRRDVLKAVFENEPQVCQVKATAE
jgi:CBS domain-containing protein